MQPEASAAAFLWNALDFARNVQIAVGDTSLETYLAAGPIAWATERQIELAGEALNNLRKVAPETVGPRLGMLGPRRALGISPRKELA